MILKGFKEFINESKSKATYQDLKLLLELGISEDITDAVYKLIDQDKMTSEEIIDFATPICDKYKIQNWSISKDGRVDVNGNVNLSGLELTKLPLRFGKVTGSFWCNNNNLTTLEGAPTSVLLSFYCYVNDLTTLKGAPREVGGAFGLFHNNLTTLEGAPKKVGGQFNCNYNKLTSLLGAPRLVGGDFYCRWNSLTTLEGIGKVKGKIDSDLNN